MAKSTSNLVTAWAIFIILGLVYFGVSALVSPEKLLPTGTVLGKGGTIFSKYMGGRNLSVAAVLTLALALNKRQVVGYLLLLNGLIQAVDAVLGFAVVKETSQGVGPLIIAIVSFIAAGYLLRENP